MEQADSSQAVDGVDCLLSTCSIGVAVADHLVRRPRPLITLVKEPDHDAPIMPGVVLADRLVRFRTHGSFASCAGPRAVAAAPGPLD